MSRRSVDPLDSPSIGRRPSPSVESRPARTETGSAPDPFDQAGFRARFDWGEAGVRALAARVGLVVVVDVLTFSTSTCIAVEQGARVVPSRSAGEATAQARSIGAIPAAPERSLAHPTLTPTSILGSRSGETLVLASPNGGACAIDAAEAGAMVVVGCLRNASAVGRLVAAHGGASAIIAAGERWPDGTLRPALEDLLGAGAILAMVGSADLSPEARAAAAAIQRDPDDPRGRDPSVRIRP